MANFDEVRDHLLEVIDKNLDEPNEYTARALRQLAEAYAWVRYPNQPHGGSPHVEPSK